MDDAAADIPETKPKKYPVTLIRYDESPTLGRLVDMGRKKCASQITAFDGTDGKPVRFLRLDQTSRTVNAGGTTLEFSDDRISVGELAWEIASLKVTWGTQNRLRYAPERPIPGARDLWLHSLSYSTGYWWEPLICLPKHIPTADDFDIAVRLGFKERQKPKP